MADLLVRWGMRDFKKLRGGGFLVMGMLLKWELILLHRLSFLSLFFLEKLEHSFSSPPGMNVIVDVNLWDLQQISPLMLSEFKGSNIVCAPFSAGWWWLYLLPKEGLGRTSIFRGGLLRKRGLTFFSEVCSFYIKNKLKSGIFIDKKSL